MSSANDEAELRRRKATLESRLDDGYDRIGEADAQGRDTNAWEQFWLALLGEYEGICEELDRMGDA